MRTPEQIKNLGQEVESLRWFHSIDFGDGIVSKGETPREISACLAEIYFRDVAGKTVLDIGCWDGFNSIEASRRGASRVVATDHFAWGPACWGDRRSFELARRELAPKIEAREIPLEGLSVETVGSFDVVIFAGVLYHLKNPLLEIERIAPLVGCEGELWVETLLDARDYERPAMVFYPGSETGDSTNWWGPNPACVEAFLRVAGFKSVEFIEHPYGSHRGVFRASKGLSSGEYLVK